MTGTAFCAGFGATGVVSPGTGVESCCDDGVVGLVEFSSEAGWLVEGVSGRGIDLSKLDSSAILSALTISSSLLESWSGSSTATADSAGAGFRFLRAFLVGHGTSGFESHGSCV